MNKRKIPRTYRLSPEAVSLLEAVAADMGIPHTSVIETAVRDLAKKRKVEASRPRKAQEEAGTK